MCFHFVFKVSASRDWLAAQIKLFLVTNHHQKRFLFFQAFHDLGLKLASAAKDCNPARFPLLSRKMPAKTNCPKKAKSPMSLTLNYLRKRGCLCVTTERWVKMAGGNGFRKDVLGGDLLAICGKSLINIQATSASHHATRVRKSLSNPEIFAYLGTGNLFQVWSWRKISLTNLDGSENKNGRWIPRVSSLILENGELQVRPFILAYQ